MYFTRWNAFCQIISAENTRESALFMKKALREQSAMRNRRRTGGPGIVCAEPPGSLFCRMRNQDFLAILDQESFSATVRLNTGCSWEWSFGSEKK